MKHATKSNDHCIKKDNPNSNIKLAGSKEIKPVSGKPFKLADATKVIGAKRKKG